MNLKRDVLSEDSQDLSKLEEKKIFMYNQGLISLFSLSFFVSNVWYTSDWRESFSYRKHTNCCHTYRCLKEKYDSYACIYVWIGYTWPEKEEKNAEGIMGNN